MLPLKIDGIWIEFAPLECDRKA